MVLDILIGVAVIGVVCGAARWLERRLKAHIMMLVQGGCPMFDMTAKIGGMEQMLSEHNERLNACSADAYMARSIALQNSVTAKREAAIAKAEPVRIQLGGMDVE